MEQDKGYTEIIKMLLQNDVDLSGVKPLYLATVLYYRYCEIIVKTRHNINFQNSDCFMLTPLYVATLCNNGSKCMGCSVGIKSKPAGAIGEHCGRRLRGLDDLTPVSKDDYVKIVKVLLMRNADVNICNIDGKNPMEVALENGNAKIVELLSEHSTNSF
ncbi:unnamed protein product [Mytilus edulis]|uniref:Ankyrin repeat protein n=1 Tax=Mytilus edulis TaxID=6550 RepID=A0A8S3RSV6_MYTED|nr:unnamed protein product [Mytilus edulis]